jgi:hypothetical protein
MAAEIDIRLGLEAGYAVRAAEDVAAITGRPGCAAAIVESRGELVAVAASHVQAVGALGRDLRETEDARSGLSEARQGVIAAYAFVRGRATDSLVNPDPTETIASATLEARRKRLDAELPLAPSDLLPMAAREVIERSKSVLSALTSDPVLSPLGLGPKLAPFVQRLDVANAAFERELGEDKARYLTIAAKRQEVERHLAAHRMLVESALHRDGRKAQAGQFVLAADAAYQARRGANVPIEEEPGAPEVETTLAPVPVD